jgi:hypothetical protein
VIVGPDNAAPVPPCRPFFAVGITIDPANCTLKPIFNTAKS